jgi:hypothetical protein
MDRSGRETRRLLASCPWLAALAIACLSPGVAFAGEGEELEAARSRVTSGNYQEAEDRLRTMLDGNAPTCPTTADLTAKGCRLTDIELVQKARGLFAIALVANGKKEEARAPIDDILLQDPYFSDSGFPQTVSDLIIEERGRRAKDIADVIAKRGADDAKKKALAAEHDKELNDYIRALETQASTQSVQETHSRWVAAIPFGVGQFQNGNIGLGLLFSVTEGLTLTTSIISTGLFLSYQQQAITKTRRQEPFDDQPFLILQAVDGVSLGLFVALAIGGIAEAEASFKQPPPINTKQPLPPKPKFMVTGVPGVPDANGLGLKVIF